MVTSKTIEAGLTSSTRACERIPLFARTRLHPTTWEGWVICAVEQIIEASARIADRLLVQLCLRRVYRCLVFIEDAATGRQAHSRRSASASRRVWALDGRSGVAVLWPAVMWRRGRSLPGWRRCTFRRRWARCRRAGGAGLAGSGCPVRGWRRRRRVSDRRLEGGRRPVPRRG
jgi:hypothetical protein